MLVHTNEKQFDEVLKKSKPVTLVDFFATWCGPCQMLGKELESLSEDKDFDIIKIDIDADAAMAAKYKIDVVPTAFIFKDGKTADRKEGYISAADVKKWVQKYL